MYIYIYVLYIYVYICKHTNVCTNVCNTVCMFVYVHECMRVEYTFVSVYVCMVLIHLVRLTKLCRVASREALLGYIIWCKTVVNLEPEMFADGESSNEEIFLLDICAYASHSLSNASSIDPDLTLNQQTSTIAISQNVQ